MKVGADSSREIWLPVFMARMNFRAVYFKRNDLISAPNESGCQTVSLLFPRAEGVWSVAKTSIRASLEHDVSSASVWNEWLFSSRAVIRLKPWKKQ